MIPENNYHSARERFRFSRLYLPGNNPGMFLNAGLHSPDGIILDLEDSVAPDRKDEARILVRNALRAVDFYGAERMVRINQGERGLMTLSMSYLTTSTSCLFRNARIQMLSVRLMRRLADQRGGGSERNGVSDADNRECQRCGESL